MAGNERDGTPHGRAGDPGNNASSSLGEIASPYDRRLAWRAHGVLAQHNAVRALDAADVHVAATLARVTDEQDETVMLAAALATRAVRQGSVAIDLRDVFPSIDPAPAQDADAWTDRVRASRLAEHRALIVEHDLVYLQRYHQQEVAVVLDLRERAAQPAPVVDEGVLAAGLPRVFPGPTYAEARAAAQIALRSWTSALTGGPGTGKTTTVAGVLALLAEQAAACGERPLRVGLAAPTGKAAARMKEAVTAALGLILQHTSDPAARAVIEPLAGVPALTLHRLLGRRNDSSTRFRYDRTHRLPHDVVVVDESSMVSLTHMARLLEALRPTTRLILVGDPDQLVSVDAGAVLADIVAGIETGTGAVAGKSQTTPLPLEGGRPNAPVALARLRTAHRYGHTIGELAEHLRAGDAGAVMGQLTSAASNLE
ncbi:MAG: AAA family ATPase, partial [Micrococcales bacterium]|nr:AAA family ATPase [Micrococcales bacterium]